MLDVDGQVVSAEALVERVEQLLTTIGAGDGEAAPGGRAEEAPLDAPVHSMRLMFSELNPPDLVDTSSVRARGSVLVKRLIRKTTSWYVEPRWAVQHEIDRQNIEFSSQAYNSVRRIEAELDELRRQNTRVKLQLVAANERVSRYRRETELLQTSVALQEGIFKGVAMQDEVQPLAREITALLDRLGAVGATGADINYVDFEDRFRGDNSELADSQERYLSLFPPSGVPGRIVDIGCGRGEMLALLEREGQEALGVDTDLGMVEVCREKGLQAVVDDGIHFLSQVADDSLKGIFCAQVVEHLITPEMEQLVRLAHRALQPGGVLVMETINPRSSFALGNHFYADTSHVRPVHPETLRFICEQVGFEQVQLEERSPHPTLALEADLPEGSVGDAVKQLLESVFGYQDYVIVATK
jgi:2-polyprenyl-3-methyl-5-hydroxy-6-metoxy-1,4-benzoquinol methylase